VCIDFSNAFETIFTRKTMSALRFIWANPHYWFCFTLVQTSNARLLSLDCTCYFCCCRLQYNLCKRKDFKVTVLIGRATIFTNTARIWAAFNIPVAKFDHDISKVATHYCDWFVIITLSQVYIIWLRYEVNKRAMAVVMCLQLLEVNFFTYCHSQHK
jgi:hypothetical protein